MVHLLHMHVNDRYMVCFQPIVSLWESILTECLEIVLQGFHMLWVETCASYNWEFFIGGRWICLVYMFCWGFIYSGWRLSFSTFGGIFLEGGWSNVAGMFEWASVLTGWRCHRTLHFLSG